MLILGIETSTSVCSLALCTPDKLVCEWSVDNGLTHSEKMMPQLEIMLAQCNIDKKAITDIAISIGPGSFTGLRIGLAAAKTMAFALGINITGVPTLKALAYNITAPSAILSPMVDGQKGNVWQAAYIWLDGKIKELQPAQLKSFSTVIKDLSGKQENVILLGENIAPDAALPQNITWAQPHLVMPRASSAANAAIDKIMAKDTDDLFALTPYYMKKSEAELLWEKKHNV